jgi:hypothetical protein
MAQHFNSFFLTQGSEPTIQKESDLCFRCFRNLREHAMSRHQHERCHFIPRLEALEDRLAPAAVGAAGQAGSMLVVGVANSGISTTLIVEDGRGDAAVSLNGGDFQIFSGVSNIQVTAQGLGNIVALFALEPLASSQLLTMNMAGLFNGLFFHMPAGGATLTAAANVSVPFIAF